MQTNNRDGAANSNRDGAAEWHLLYITDHGWDFENEEPVGGGRCLGSFDTWAAAMRAYGALKLATPLLWGPGHLGITNSAHELVYSVTLLPTHSGAVKGTLAKAGLAKASAAK